MNTNSDGRAGGAGGGSSSNSRAQRSKRYRVHLEIQYRVDGDYVPGFAENVSRGGLFIVGAQDLAMGTVLDVQFALPGGPEFTVPAEVRHVLPSDTAKRLNRKPGAGMMFQEKPAGFDASVSNYLFRLTRREEVAVMVTDASSEELIRSAGYVTQRAPKADAVAEALLSSMTPVVGVVVRSDEVEPYRKALESQDAEDLVIELEDVREFDETLSQLDKRLSEETPVALTSEDMLGEMEEVPGQKAKAPPPTPHSPGRVDAAVSAAARAPTRAPTRAATSPTAPRGRPSSARTPAQRGPSYAFMVICILVAAAIGFAAAFLMYFDRPTTQYPRRTSRSTCAKCVTCAKCKPCPPPTARIAPTAPTAPKTPSPPPAPRPTP